MLHVVTYLAGEGQFVQVCIEDHNIIPMLSFHITTFLQSIWISVLTLFEKVYGERRLGFSYCKVLAPTKNYPRLFPYTFLRKIEKK